MEIQENKNTMEVKKENKDEEIISSFKKENETEKMKSEKPNIPNEEASLIEGKKQFYEEHVLGLMKHYYKKIGYLGKSKEIKENKEKEDR